MNCVFSPENKSIESNFTSDSSHEFVSSSSIPASMSVQSLSEGVKRRLGPEISWDSLRKERVKIPRKPLESTDDFFSRCLSQESQIIPSSAKRLKTDSSREIVEKKTLKPFLGKANSQFSSHVVSLSPVKIPSASTKLINLVSLDVPKSVSSKSVSPKNISLPSSSAANVNFSPSFLDTPNESIILKTTKKRREAQTKNRWNFIETKFALVLSEKGKTYSQIANAINKLFFHQSRALKNERTVAGKLRSIVRTKFDLNWQDSDEKLIKFFLIGFGHKSWRSVAVAFAKVFQENTGKSNKSVHTGFCFQDKAVELELDSRKGLNQKVINLAERFIANEADETVGKELRKLAEDPRCFFYLPTPSKVKIASYSSSESESSDSDDNVPLLAAAARC